MHPHRIATAALVAELALGLSACGGQQAQPVEEAPPSKILAPGESSAPSASGPATPSGNTSPSSGSATPPGGPATPKPGQTDPEKLDSAMLQAADLPGWAPSGDHADFADTAVEPALCEALHRATVGKVASDMGAMAAYTKDDLYVQEFLEVVNRGTDSVGAVEKLVGSCPEFTMVDADERTAVKVTRFDAPGIGERSLGIKLTMQGEVPVDMLVVVAAHKDVLLTTALQGEAPQPTMATALTKQAMDKLKKSV